MICIYDGEAWVQVDNVETPPALQIALEAIRNLEARVAELESHDIP